MEAALQEEIGELARGHGLVIRPDTLRVEEAGLDCRVAFADGEDGAPWVLRIPRRPDVTPRLADEARVLRFVAPRLSVAVPRWSIHTETLVAYPRLPGAPGL